MTNPATTPLSMPPILYGTAWKKEQTATLVEQALTQGFRGIDTACQPKHYNEPGVGQGIAACLSRGLTRQELYLQTKFTSLSGQDPARVPYDPKAPLAEQIRASCDVSLKNLRTSYLDALVLHSPLPSLGQTQAAWRIMEGLVERGLVRSLGLSNCYDLATLQALHRAAAVKPALLQNRFYRDTGYDVTLRAFCQTANIKYQSFWTLSANPELLADAWLVSLARHYAVTREQLLYRGLTQLGIVPLSGTTNPKHMREDLAIFDFALTPPELETLAARLTR